MKKLSFLLMLFFVTMIAIVPAESKDISEKSRDELKKDFDKVVQNFGAFEFAYYTFTLEHKRPPENVKEFKESGHIRVKMVDPYTGGEVFIGERGEDDAVPGGLYYHKIGEEWGEFECWFVNPNDSKKLRSLYTKIKQYTHEAIHGELFKSGLSRDEQLTIINLLQLSDAIDSFEQKIGRLPKTLDEMREIGDVNVDYINPFTGEIVKYSDELSPGDYMYKTFTGQGFITNRKINDEGELVLEDVPVEIELYEVVGWGKDEPVYYYSTDPSREEFLWDEDDAEEKEDGQTAHGVF